MRLTYLICIIEVSWPGHFTEIACVVTIVIDNTGNALKAVVDVSIDSEHVAGLGHPGEVYLQEIM